MKNWTFSFFLLDNFYIYKDYLMPCPFRMLGNHDSLQISFVYYLWIDYLGKFVAFTSLFANESEKDKNSCSSDLKNHIFYGPMSNKWFMSTSLRHSNKWRTTFREKSKPETMTSVMEKTLELSHLCEAENGCCLKGVIFPISCKFISHIYSM